MLPMLCDVSGFLFSANSDSRLILQYSSASAVGKSNLIRVNGGFSNILNTNGQILLSNIALVLRRIVVFFRI